MKPPHYQGVLLDLDGTLIDAFKPIIAAMRQTLAEFGLAPMSDEAIKRHTGRGDCSMTALFGDKKDAAVQRFIEIHDLTYLQDIQIMPGAEVLLDFLYEKGIPMAVVTSKGQHRAEAQIEELGWHKYFTSIVGKLEGRASKPSPEPVCIACKAIGISPQQAMMIGDGEADMKAATRAGCFAVGLTHSFSQEELKENGASICFKSLNEVYQWLK
jgi:phosphoglycolate phosphatase-like HAD superfamily hydrolase